MTVRRTLAYTCFTSGILFGGLGTYLDSITLARTGLLFALLSIPLYVRMHHQLREDQIQKADTAGYMRALDHVARGLLDQSNHGQPGPGEALGDRPDNVIPLNADVPIWADDGHEQKAQ